MEHCDCIADPSNFPLYVENSLAKEDTALPICRCARGSTSFEGFYLHVNLTNPSNSVKTLNMQYSILDGPFRWNTHWAAEAYGTPIIISSDIDMKENVKTSSKKIR